MNMTNFFEMTVLNAMRGTTAVAPSSVFLALYLSDPTETGTAGTEVQYAGYARQQIIFSAPTTTGTTVRMENAEEIVFPMPPGEAGTVTHAGIMTAQSGGNMLAHISLSNPIVLAAGSSPRFAAGNAQLIMSGGNIDPSFKVRVLNYIRGTTINGFSPFIAMFDADPTDGGAELGGIGYARIPIEFDQPAEQPSGQMQTQNTNSEQTLPATSNWGIWAFTVIMDAETSGSRVCYRQNIASYNMSNLARAYVAPGQVIVALN